MHLATATRRFWPARAVAGVAMAILISAFVLPAPALASTADHCTAGQTPHFVFGFADLHNRLGDQMGLPVSCEFPDPKGTGDVHQQTTKGLSFWRKSTNTATFTNGDDHWALTSRGLVHWNGSSIDPPATVSSVSPPSKPAAAPTTSALPTDPNLRSTMSSTARDINAFWSSRLTGYSSFDLYWYRGPITNGCGFSTGGGPFYCGLDRSVNLDTDFFERYWNKGWKFGLQTVIAHEIGHHIQRLDGLRRTLNPTLPGQVFSIDLELGADCLAGVWAGNAYTRGLVDKDDMLEAWTMTFNAGDTTPWYDPSAHGTPTQRTNAFMLGVTKNNAETCLAL
jgi:predicted metalloprotease